MKKTEEVSVTKESSVLKRKANRSIPDESDVKNKNKRFLVDLTKSSKRFGK